MSRHHLIQDYLAALRGLPAEVVDELTDGLLDTYEHHRARGYTPDGAAHAAIAEFGPARDVVAAFDRIAPGRRTARALLATGPLVGLCWGTALITTRLWTWPIPAWAPPAFGGALATVIVVLIVAAQASRGRARHAAVAAAGTTALLDVLIITGVFATAPSLSWPLEVALMASFVRAFLSVRTLPGILAY